MQQPTGGPVATLRRAAARDARARQADHRDGQRARARRRARPHGRVRSRGRRRHRAVRHDRDRGRAVADDDHRGDHALGRPQEDARDDADRPQARCAPRRSRAGSSRASCRRPQLEAETRAARRVDRREVSPAAIALGLHAFYRSQDMELEPALRYLQGELGRVLALEDAAEGIAAFLGKRKPVWKGTMKILRIDHVQLAIPPGGEAAARAVLRRGARARRGAEARGDARAGRHVVRGRHPPRHRARACGRPRRCTRRSWSTIVAAVTRSGSSRRAASGAMERTCPAFGAATRRIRSAIGSRSRSDSVAAVMSHV